MMQLHRPRNLSKKSTFCPGNNKSICRCLGLLLCLLMIHSPVSSQTKDVLGLLDRVPRLCSQHGNTTEEN